MELWWAPDGKNLTQIRFVIKCSGVVSLCSTHFYSAWIYGRIFFRATVRAPYRWSYCQFLDTTSSILNWSSGRRHWAVLLGTVNQLTTTSITEVYRWTTSNLVLGIARYIPVYSFLGYTKVVRTNTGMLLRFDWKNVLTDDFPYTSKLRTVKKQQQQLFYPLFCFNVITLSTIILIKSK